MAFLVRAPASRAGNPGSRPARCDGADPGGLHQHKAGATGFRVPDIICCMFSFFFSFFFYINQHKKKKDGFDNIVVSFNNHCLTCSD